MIGDHLGDGGGRVILGMVGEHPGNDGRPFMGSWVTILGILGDNP